MNDDDAPTFERYVHTMTADELRKALHDMTLVVAHLVVQLGGVAHINRASAPDIGGGWVAVRHDHDGNMTLRYCPTRAEVDDVTAEAVALRRGRVN
jgi:hypothetical protein